MRGGGGNGRPERRRRRNSTSPLKDRTETTSSKLSSSSSSKLSSSSSATTLIDVDDSNAVLFDYYTNPNPRSFPHSVKQKCWEKADKVKGRDPDRWRRDPLGNLIFRKLVGCPGCLCHDYDHIVPYSKGGKSTLENCQVLQVRQELIGQRVIEQISPNQILFRRVLIAGFQAVIWIFWNCLLLAMFNMDKIPEDVEFNKENQ
ncbi:unnamed protein product [Trifolium pratense]|uniref:Uncharacterized protein n=1 Tax=Trifolium pratense TaxID=57577 RepID=A0ACB0L7I1_TRIPR|nr:unnamed protein product [Trifolium pratense]